MKLSALSFKGPAHNARRIPVKDGRGIEAFEGKRNSINNGLTEGSLRVIDVMHLGLKNPHPRWLRKHGIRAVTLRV